MFSVRPLIVDKLNLPVTNGRLVCDDLHRLDGHGLVELVHGCGTQARHSEKCDAVEQERSKQGGQDHKPEPHHDEYLREKLTRMYSPTSEYKQLLKLGVFFSC